jgi:hypothetical protein
MSKITLYEGLKTLLTGLGYDGTNAAGNAVEAKTVQHVALWRNQIERENVEQPFNYPAVFIEFLTSNYMEASSGAFQQLDLTVRLHICFESYKDEDLDILRLTQAVFSAVQGKQFGLFGKLKRRNEEQNFDHPNVQDFIQDYDVGRAKDYGADARLTTEATINTINIIPEIDT